MAYARYEDELGHRQMVRRSAKAAALVIQNRLGGVKPSTCEGFVDTQGRPMPDCPFLKQCRSLPADLEVLCELDDDEAARVALRFGWDWTLSDPPDEEEEDDEYAA